MEIVYAPRVTLPPPPPHLRPPTASGNWFSRLRTWQKIAIPAVAVVVFCGFVGALFGDDDDDGPAGYTGYPLVGEPSSAGRPSAAPSNAPEVKPDETASCEGLTDQSSGRPLCEFVDSETYRFRLAIANNVDELLPAVQAIAPWTEASNLSDVISTCGEVAEGRVDIDNAVARFSGGPDEQVTRADARELVRISRQFVCP